MQHFKIQNITSGEAGRSADLDDLETQQNKGKKLKCFQNIIFFKEEFLAPSKKMEFEESEPTEKSVINDQTSWNN